MCRGLKYGQEEEKEMKKILAIAIAAILFVSTFALFTKNTSAQTYSTTSLNVQPALTNTALGSTFSVNVTISDLSALDNVVGVQFRLCYDASLLQAVSVFEGPFMKNVAWAPYGTWYLANIEVDPTYGPCVLVGDLIFPDGNGVWNAFPSGNGTVATITFQVIHAGVQGQPPLTTLLTLANDLLLNDALNEISHTVNNGLVRIYAQPSLNVQPATTNTGLGAIFSVDVTITGLSEFSRAVGVQFRLCYDASLLQAVSVFEGPFMKNVAWAPYGTWYLANIEVDPTYGPCVLVGDLIFPDGNGVWNAFPSGNGTVATVAFKAINAGVPGQPPVTTLLTLANDLIISDVVGEVPHFIHNGLVNIYAQPSMSVQPPIVETYLIGTTFSIDITISNLTEFYRVVGIQFRLCYDDTLLEVVSVTEGPFMKNVAWAPYGTFFLPSVEVDPTYGPCVLVGDLIFPDGNGVWNAFPSGNGVLATITFKAINQGRLGTALSCLLNLKNTLIINDDLGELPHDLYNGFYKIYSTNIGDINFDGKVDMKDIGLVASAFGAHPGHPRWNEAYDVILDGKIDMRDIAIVAHNFGWHGT
jgi:hypothetical protein